MNKMEVLKGRKGQMQPHVVLHSALGKDLIVIQVKKGLGRVAVLAQWGLRWQTMVLQKELDAAGIHAGDMCRWFRQEQKHALVLVSCEGCKPPELHAKGLAFSRCVP
jgi:hypothetical protein